jgi:hypothetical protein
MNRSRNNNVRAAHSEKPNKRKKNEFKADDVQAVMPGSGGCEGEDCKRIFKLSI